jgi:hypothetical protein
MRAVAGRASPPARRRCYPRMVDAFVERVVRRLRSEPGFSRNRHYVAFSSPEGRRALRIHRHLRSIERDLSGGAEATIERGDDRVRITLRSRRGLRTAFLTTSELRILCTNPLVRSALGEP